MCGSIVNNGPRKKSKIKGIKINQIKVLLSQFADDTTPCLDRSEESFKQSMQTLYIIALFSGLKFNDNKTEFVWIGCKQNSNVRFPRDMDFCWDP